MLVGLLVVVGSRPGRRLGGTCSHIDIPVTHHDVSGASPEEIETTITKRSRKRSSPYSPGSTELRLHLREVGLRVVHHRVHPAEINKRRGGGPGISGPVDHHQEPPPRDRSSPFIVKSTSRRARHDDRVSGSRDMREITKIADDQVKQVLERSRRRRRG